MGLSKKKQRNSPFMSKAHQRTLHTNLEFTAAEQYKLLRTNLEFTIPEGTKCPVIGITSAMRGEGKSTTSINLSYALAEKGSKVLLIDGDLRVPSVAKKMGIPSIPGLTDVLMGKSDQIEDYRSSLLDTWYVMPSGNIPPNPSELLGSKRMEAALEKFRNTFDYIVIDLPPVNIVSDALSIANFVTGVVLVIREGYTGKKELEYCFRQLKFSDVNLLGCVMNDAKAGNGSYRKYKRHKYYKYYKNEYGTRSKKQKK